MTTETITVMGDNITVSKLVWRRFKRPMAGLIERIYELNPLLADNGVFLPVGTLVIIPIDAPRTVERRNTIRLW